MKNLSLKWTSGFIAIFLIAITSSCMENHNMENHKMETGDMEMEKEKDGSTVNLQGEPQYMVDYIAIKDALVNDNFEQVKKLATSMQESLGDAGLQSKTELEQSLQSLLNANDIQAQRKEFSRLSQNLYQIVKNEDVSDKNLYWQHCPMAHNGEGANWLSYEERVRNPYMGQRMPGCGSVKEKIGN